VLIDKGFGLGLIDDFSAVGAFRPVDQIDQTAKGEIPYAVNLTHPGFKNPSRQLLVNGPGFFAVPGKPQKTEVVAYYTDRNKYEFDFGKGSVKRVTSLPAMISRKHTETRGGVFLSGTHFYASVEGSKLLGAFETKSKDVTALPEDDYRQLNDLDERENTRVTVEILLRRTLK
jgi:hypothetical protein